MRIKDIYLATELSSLLMLLPDINIDTDCTDHDWCNFNDRLHDILIRNGRLPNDELNELGLLAESLIEPIP
jgi:hypothetical protein